MSSELIRLAGSTMSDFVKSALEPVFTHLWSCLGGQLSYVWNLEKNLATLEKAKRVLGERRADVLRKVQSQESEGLQRLNEVEGWLTSVENIQNQVDALLFPRSDELERLCLCGLCTKNLSTSHYSYGRRVFEMLEEVEDVHSKGVFEVVAVRPTIAEAEERPLPNTIVGQENMLERAWEHLVDPRTGIMGLYGMGGVGKTTLLEQINNRFFNRSVDGVEKVIFVVVSSELRVEMIQDAIAGKLGFPTDDWKKKDKSQKVTDLHTRLKTKKFVLLLDDIWEEVDLKELGVPFPTKDNGCKVVFTTRLREVCGQMGVHDPMEVKCLGSNEAWELFRAKVGEITFESHSDIFELVRQVAGECRGLPLALNIIGKNMASKRTVEDWEQAIDKLTSSAAEIPGMEDHIFPILKYSYDSLKSEHVQSCFLYCALFPEDFAIEKKKLVDYWICEEFIDEKQGRKKARNEAYVIIGTLVEACLLTEEGKDKSAVKMHDVVREMALWIATDFGKDKERCIVKAGVDLSNVPTVENWRSVRRMSLMDNEIEKIYERPNCPELTTLLVQKNKIENISGGFFKSMPRLVVLDLSYNKFENGLPDEISKLVSLRYLDLSYTDIKRLPGGLLKLMKLIHLNLEATRSLKSISGISNLSSMRILRLKDSHTLIDLSLVAELELLQHLEVVTIDISLRKVAKKLLRSQRLVKCIEYVGFKNLEVESSGVLTLPTMVSLRRLVIMSCGMREIKIEGTASSSTTCFPNLSSVIISGCHVLVDLTWLLFAQNLTDLEVGQSKKLKEIISEEKAVNSNIVPFRKLNKLTLRHLEELKSIYWSPLPFPALKEISVTWCPELRKLPLDSKSVARVEELEIYWIPLSSFPKEVYKMFAPLDEIHERWDLCSPSAAPGTLIPMKNEEKGWLEEVEWEDEATRLRFLPYCTLQHY